jgi:hypothetical protein
LKLAPRSSPRSSCTEFTLRDTASAARTMGLQSRFSVQAPFRRSIRHSRPLDASCQRPVHCGRPVPQQPTSHAIVWDWFPPSRPAMGWEARSITPNRAAPGCLNPGGFGEGPLPSPGRTLELGHRAGRTHASIGTARNPCTKRRDRVRPSPGATWHPGARTRGRAALPIQSSLKGRAPFREALSADSEARDVYVRRRSPSCFLAYSFTAKVRPKP